MTESHVDPFRLLVDRRAEAEAAGTDPEKARKSALAEASEIILPIIEKSAKFTFRGPENRHVREEAVSGSLESLCRQCEKIYDNKADPPGENWKGYIDTTVRHEGYDVSKKERSRGGKKLGRAYVISLDAPDSTGNPAWDSILADGAGSNPWTEVGVADVALNRVDRDVLLARLSRLHADVTSRKLVCAFHPGQHCSHVRTGRVGGTCRHLDVVFEAIGEKIFEAMGETIISGAPEHIREVLIRRTGYDSNQQGNQLRRHVYRCLDWFTYLLLRDSSSFVGDLSVLSTLSIDRVVQHLIRGGTDAPSATTLCIIMNGYSDIPIPEQLMHQYGPVHLDRTEGESR